MASSPPPIGDEELRRRLLGYGENFPITESNRRILLAKLKRLDEEAAKRNKVNVNSENNRSTLLNFSSSEDSDQADRRNEFSGADNNSGKNSAVSSGSSSNLRKTRRIRTSVAHVAPSASTSTANRRRSTVTTVQPNNNSNNINNLSDNRSTNRSPPVDLNINDSGASSKHVASPSKMTRSATRSSVSAYASTIRYSTPSALSPAAPASHPSNLDISDSDVSDSSMSNIPEHRDVSEFPRSRRSMYADWTSTTPSPTPSAPPLSLLSSSSSSSSGGLRWSTSSPRVLNGNHDPAAGDLSQGLSDGAINGESSDEDHTNSSQCVSMVLLAIVALFFLIVSGIYLGVRHRDLVPYAIDSSTVTSVGPVCNPSSGESCIIADIANSLKNTLREIAGEAECNGHSDNPISRRMPIKEAERRVMSLAGFREVRFSDVLIVFSKNPLWGVRLLREDGTAIPSFELSHVQWLESAITNVPLLCRLKLAFLKTIFRSAIILAVFVVVVLVGYVSYAIYEWKRKEREEVIALVEKILDILQDNGRACQGDSKMKPYLAIPHVRDMLLPPAERKSSKHIWEKAVNFIQNNESRVRFEIQRVQGEDFTVWRWVQPDARSPGSSKSPASHKSPRLWQGQAFETLESGMNALPCSPTSCLKVRNMFDPDVEYEDDWPFHIQDAILEKCIDSDIVHLKVDSSSNEGCVYIKCKDSATAGKVYRDLHGWWFDGKLVTVKYLRLERYHARFPEARGCFRFLRPNSTASPVRLRNRSATLNTKYW